VVVIVAFFVAYVVFLKRSHRARLAARDTIQMDGRDSQPAICDSPTYQETKEPMRKLRRSLDRFGETVDGISLVERRDGPDELDAAFSDGIPRLHGALVDARNAAEALLAAVEQREPEDPLVAEVVGTGHRSPRSQGPGTLGTRTRAERLYESLLATVGKMGPNIAGFYFALLDRSVEAQTSQAVAQVGLIIKQLDGALKRMTALEQELSQR
jgi:hypothetical protein